MVAPVTGHVFGRLKDKWRRDRHLSHPISEAKGPNRVRTLKIMPPCSRQTNQSSRVVSHLRGDAREHLSWPSSPPTHASKVSPQRLLLESYAPRVSAARLAQRARFPNARAQPARAARANTDEPAAPRALTVHARVIVRVYARRRREPTRQRVRGGGGGGRWQKRKGEGFHLPGGIRILIWGPFDRQPKGRGNKRGPTTSWRPACIVLLANVAGPDRICI